MSNNIGDDDDDDDCYRHELAVTAAKSCKVQSAASAVGCCGQLTSWRHRIT